MGLLLPTRLPNHSAPTEQPASAVQPSSSQNQALSTNAPVSEVHSRPGPDRSKGSDDFLRRTKSGRIKKAVSAPTSASNRSTALSAANLRRIYNLNREVEKLGAARALESVILAGEKVDVKVLLSQVSPQVSLNVVDLGNGLGKALEYGKDEIAQLILAEMKRRSLQVYEKFSKEVDPEEVNLDDAVVLANEESPEKVSLD